MVTLRCEAERPSGRCPFTLEGVTRDAAVALARARGWQVPDHTHTGPTYCGMCARLIRAGRLPQPQARRQAPLSAPDDPAGAVEEAIAAVDAHAALEAPDAALRASPGLAVSPDIAYARCEAGACPWCGGPGEAPTNRLGDLERAAAGLPPIERPLEEASLPGMTCCCGTCFWRRPEHHANGACKDCPIRIKVQDEDPGPTVKTVPPALYECRSLECSRFDNGTGYCDDHEPVGPDSFGGSDYP